MQSLLRHIILGVTLPLMAVLAGCSDDLGQDSPSVPGSLTVRLVTGADGGSRADVEGSPDLLSPATADERRINDLRLFAFPVDGGQLLKVSLTPLPTADEMADERYKNYVIEDVTPGKYRIYVIANQPSCADVMTEDELKARVLRYSETELPVPGDLPMVYEPREVTEISAGGSAVTANLQFTCVKVRYNLIFDKVGNQATAESFGSNGLIISSVRGERLTASTPLVLGGAMSTLNSGGTDNTFAASLPSGRYFADWTETPDAPGDMDVIDTSGQEAPASYADRWVYQGTVYLPERYLSDDKEQSELVVEAVVADPAYGPAPDGTVGPDIPAGAKNTYRIPLGHSNAEGQPRQFPRGTYYEIIGRIETTEFTEYQTEVRVRDWVPVAMADFGHTTLAVDKTKASVGSLRYDSICYTSNAPEVIMGCDEAIDGRPVIVQYAHDKERGVLSFRINPEIPVSAFREGSEFPPHGSTKVWVQANNLRKYLDVEYDVTPMFEVRPLEVTINWLENQPDSPTYVKTFSYQTNLGGIDFIGRESDFTLTDGASTIKIECADPTAAIGTFTVTATTNPVNETVHEFTVGPRDAGRESMRQDIRVTVKPPVGNYRILFRAINDNQGAHDGGWNQVTFNTPLAEGEGNWTDGWDGYHNIYVYTQIGETVGGNIPEYYVWRFTGSWPGEAMSRSQYAGWYLKEFTPEATASNVSGENEAYRPESIKKIKPGETLLMFNANRYEWIDGKNKNDRGESRHRCTHHLDPGMQLFDYEDREGWIIYDPLIQMPYYTVFDSRPEVRNVTYTVYSTKKPVKWYRKYGKSDSDGVFTVGANIASQACQDASGKIWYKTIGMVFKSPEGQYAKYITIVFDDNTEAVLFNGANFIDDESNASGSYDNGRWSQEIPKGLSESKVRTVYIKSSGTPNAYCWIDGTTECPVTWPGAVMTSLGNSWWKYEFDIKYNMVKFSFNGNSGTADFSCPDLKNYYDWNGVYQYSDKPE